MTEEEKKAIEYLNLVAKGRTLIPLCDDIKTLLNLIQKQDTEINKLNNKLKEIKRHIKAELHTIETCRKDLSREGNLQYDGMEAAYKCILNCFFMKEDK